ncbi:MAG TPA: formate--tetrahydrofolate ligase [Vicinamibacteria bacterium]|nr:formate--tetrahydrofolate ligase [Vicinamibacteria bacterium]
MKSDIEISRSVTPEPIATIADKLGLEPGEWHPFGPHIAKVDPAILSRPARSKNPRLVLVSAITPTPAGEGKTTTSIGLAQGLAKLGESACLALREPSLGPCMGMKGGATGGGYSQVYPMDRINLHFTGDFHAVTSAHNLLSAALDNQLHFGNALAIDPRRVTWKRVIDMNDRSLRKVVVGLGGPLQGVPRETGFDITAASEIMAILCLAANESDLRRRVDGILIGFTYGKEPVVAAKLNVSGAVLALLRDALQPNLVQTLEGVPAFIHGGPFANIAHGCNSVAATRCALHLADWAVTEAGFGFDLGGEKFFDIKCRSAGLNPAAVVLVSTVRALKMHGGKAKDGLTTPDPGAVRFGLANLDKHLENVQHFGKTAVVALNRFGSDSDEEIEVVRKRCEELSVPFAVSDHHARGGEGAIELARTVMRQAAVPSAPAEPLYQISDTVPEKVRKVARKMYGARDVVFTKEADKQLAEVERLGYTELPVCIAKTQNSLSDDPALFGRPEDFDITVSGIEINAGAGFLVVLTGDIMRMPGLPRRPRAEDIDLVEGQIEGLQ